MNRSLRRYCILGVVCVLLPGYVDGLGVRISGGALIPCETSIATSLTANTAASRGVENVESLCGPARGVVSAARDWSGFMLFSQGPTELLIVVSEESRDFGNAHFSFDTNWIVLNLDAGSDIVAHETGHAVIHAIKPGWTTGAALVIHEALADMFTVLASLRDPDAVDRIIATINGDLSAENEASRIVELPDGTALRSARSKLALDDIPFPRNKLRMSQLSFRGSRGDPHRAAVVLTAALYDVVLFRVGQRISDGESAHTAIPEVADESGRCMIAALFVSPEHRITLEMYSIVLIDAFASVVDESSLDEIRAIFVCTPVISDSDSGGKRTAA